MTKAESKLRMEIPKLGKTENHERNIMKLHKSRTLEPKSPRSSAKLMFKIHTDGQKWNPNVHTEEKEKQEFKLQKSTQYEKT